MQTSNIFETFSRGWPISTLSGTQTIAGEHPMENFEKRRDTRYPIEAKVIVHRSGGADIPALAVNISASGMLLKCDTPSTFNLDEELTVDVELPDDPTKPLSTWGVAKVVRANGCQFAVEIFAGMFNPDI
jgi:hypothetical protein